MDENNKMNGNVEDTNKKESMDIPKDEPMKKQTKKSVDKMVKIRLPKTREDKAPVPVWVNDRSWLIERGVTVEVPECVAEVLRHRDEMLEVGIAFDEANEKK